MGAGRRRDFSGNRGIRRAAQVAARMSGFFEPVAEGADDLLDSLVPYNHRAVHGDLLAEDAVEEDAPPDDPADSAVAPPVMKEERRHLRQVCGRRVLPLREGGARARWGQAAAPPAVVEAGPAPPAEEDAGG